MAKNLRKFSTLADYNNASLSYPSVSWITSLDIVKYDKEAPTPPPLFKDDDIVISFDNTLDEYATVNLWNGANSPWTELTAMTIISSARTTSVSNPSTTYQHTLNDESGVITLVYGTDSGYTNMGSDEYFSSYYGVGVGYDTPETMPKCDVLIPSKFTNLYMTPINTKNLVMMATTPPLFGISSSEIQAEKIYVPDESLEVYQAAHEEQYYMFYPLSEYDGILPINNN